jgi:hypothetical protein
VNPSTKDARIKVYTSDAVIEGRLHLGYKGRVSDVVNEDDRFLILVDVVKRPGDDGEDTSRHETFLLRKDEVKHIIPFD